MIRNLHMVLALLLSITAAEAQTPEVYLGKPSEFKMPAQRPPNYLAKCLANPDDKISCHLASESKTSGDGRKNYLESHVAPSAYVNCGGPARVCLEVATFDPTDGVKARLPSIDVSILFDFDAATIRDSETGKIRQLATAISDPINAKARFLVVGHTDSMGTVSYNCSLSLRRAKEVTSRLAELGVDPAKLLAVGAGEKLLRNKRNGGSEENRRVGFAQISESGQPVIFQMLKVCQN